MFLVTYLHPAVGPTLLLSWIDFEPPRDVFFLRFLMNLIFFTRFFDGVFLIRLPDLILPSPLVCADLFDAVLFSYS